MQATVLGSTAFDEAMEKYRQLVKTEHGSVINPITGEEVDIMQQCVNLQLDAGNNHDVGDTDAYSEVIVDFAERLPQGIIAWTALEDGKYQRGNINRVNSEDGDAATYDFQYVKRVTEGGKQVDKTFIVKDRTRMQIKTRQLLVKGDPAGGKTTFAKQLLTWIMCHSKTSWLLPVVIRTVDLVRNKDSFIDDGSSMVDQYLAMRYAEDGVYVLFNQARLEGRLLIILDGFDEAGTLEGRLATEIKHELSNNVFIVLTSRDMGAVFDGPAFERFRSVRVKDLSLEQQRQVISRRLGTKERAEQFGIQLTLNPALGHMAKNPLLLTVTLAVFEASGLDQEVSLSRGKVYSMALDGMLGNLEMAKSAHGSPKDEAGSSYRSISAVALRAVLKRVAFLAHTHENGKGLRDFRRDLIKRAIETSGVGTEFTMAHWSDVEDVIKRGRLPVLAWFVEGGEDTFRFSHLTFQEFLCAEQCLQESLNDEEFILQWRELVCASGPYEIIAKGWWQQTIQMYCDLAVSAGAHTKSRARLDTTLGEIFLRLNDHDGYTLRFNERINDSNILTVVSMLRTNHVLTSIALGNAISSYGASTLQSLKLGSLSSLCLNNNRIGPDGCNSIALFMDSSGAPLQNLELVNNIICQGAAKKDMPPESRRNPETGYYDSYLPDLHGFAALLDVVKRHPTLKSVDVRSNCLNLDAGRMLAEAVIANQTLEMVCGIPVRELRDEGTTELIYKNQPVFIGGWRRAERAEPFLATGGAAFLLELLLRFPQPNLTSLCLANQGLASDAKGVVELFDKLGIVAAAADRLEMLDLSGFWDCGAAAGRALGNRIKDHPRLRLLKVGMGSLDLEMVRAKGRAGTDESLVLTGSLRGIRDCGAGVLSACLPPNIIKLVTTGAGIGSSGYKILSQCPHLKDINGIQLEQFMDTCTTLDLSLNPAYSTGAVACVLARTALTPNLTCLNLSRSNLTSKSHIHVLTPVLGGSGAIGCNGGCDDRAFHGTNAYMNCAECDLDFCSTCCMSECPMIALAEAVGRLPHLVSLNIADCAFEGGRDGGPVRSHLDEEGYRVLGVALSKHKTLSDLDISLNYFQGPGFPHLARGIALMLALKTLKVGSDTIDFCHWLTDEVIKPTDHSLEAELLLLARAIGRNSKVRRLDLSATTHLLTERVSQALVESLSGTTDDTTDVCHDDASPEAELARRSVSMKRVMLDTLVLDGAELCFAQLRDGSISSLDFSNAVFNSRAWVAPLFALMLQFGGSLTHIDFSNMVFGAATDTVVSAILPLVSGKLCEYNRIDLRPGKNLEVLSVQQRPVMPHGICVMASTTIPNGNITQLNLSDCGMDGASLGVLLASLLRRQTVLSLDVSNQALGKCGVQELADFLRQDKKLQVLHARRISMPRTNMGEMLEFSRAIDTNITLVELDLRKNSLHDALIKRLVRTMEEKRSVVPFPIESKLCFLQCNRHLPHHLQLPEVTQVADFSNLFFSYGAYSPTFLIFQYCAQPRRLLIDMGSARYEGRDGGARGFAFWSHESSVDSDVSSFGWSD